MQYGPDINYGSVATSTGYGSLVESTGVFSRHPTVSLPWSPGTVYHYRIVMTDPAGNVTTTGDFTNTPTVSITAPANLATVSGGVQITANAMDMQPESLAFSSRLTGIISVLPVTGTGPSYSFSWNSTTATNGAHALDGDCREHGKRNATTSATVSVTVNNSAPPVISAVSVSSVTSSRRHDHLDDGSGIHVSGRVRDHAQLWLAERIEFRTCDFSFSDIDGTDAIHHVSLPGAVAGRGGKSFGFSGDFTFSPPWPPARHRFVSAEPECW